VQKGEGEFRTGLANAATALSRIVLQLDEVRAERERKRILCSARPLFVRI